MKRLGLIFLVLGCVLANARAQTAFQEGRDAYQLGDYKTAAHQFRKDLAMRLTSGSFYNLGNAEWQLKRTGQAILAWERALWIDAFDGATRNNLAFARRSASLPSPELTWYEVISGWLPVNAWAWITGTSLWLSIGVMLLPGIFRARKQAWHQAVAALGLTVFLLGIPAQAGVHTRCRLGFVLERNTPLRLTPTADAQSITTMAAGEPVRVKRWRGEYALVRTSRGDGWLQRNNFELIAGNSAPLAVP